MKTRRHGHPNDASCGPDPDGIRAPVSSPHTDSRKDNTAAGHATQRAVAGPVDAGNTSVGTQTLYLLAGAVALLTGVVYLRCLRNDFVNWDDQVYVFENRNIRLHDWQLIRWAFCGFHEGNWHPLTWLSHALDYAFWGLNPLGHHLTSATLHALNSSLVVVLVAKLVEAARPVAIHLPPFPCRVSRPTLVAAVTTGLLFGLHPMHVESVAWISERKDLLCAFFFLLSVSTHIRYAGMVTDAAQAAPPARHDAAQRDSTPCAVGPPRAVNWYYFATLGFFVLALMSKPMAVSLPAVLLILDWYPFKRLQSPARCQHAFIEKLPMVTLSVVSSVVTVLAQREEAALTVIAPPLSARVAVVARSLIAYLCKMAVPYHLSPVYPYPRDASLLFLPYALAAAAVIGITIGCAAMASKHPVWLAVWGYYVVTLLPVIGIVQVGSQSMADRYSYLPSLGPFLLMGIGAARVYVGVRAAKTRRALGRPVAVAAAALVVVGMSYVTVRQIDIWKNGITLWSHVIETQPNEALKAYINRGVLFQAAGDFDRALADFDRAIALNPARLGIYVKPTVYYEAYLRRGQVFEAKGERERALADFNTVNELDPSYGAAYRNRAGLFERAGQVQKAIAELDRAIALSPNEYETYIEKGILCGKYRSLEEAVDQFSAAIRRDPHYAPAFGNRGWAYSIMGQHQRGLDDLTKAIELDPGYATAYFYRAHAHRALGKRALARADFRKACELGEKAACDGLQSLEKESGRRQ